MTSIAQRLGYKYRSQALRKSFCLTSYFRKPEQGVRDWEELSRSSAFLLKSKHKSAKYHIVSAAHVTHPFLYPRLYPEEFPRFLSFLKESDVKVALQYRQENTGVLLDEFPLKTRLTVRVDSDLVVGHLQDEETFENILKHKFGLSVDPLELIQGPISPNSEVEIIGHDFTTNWNGHPVLIPVTLPGRLLATSKRRGVVDTPQPSVMGLCGGPALLLDSTGAPSHLVAGMVEGRIQRLSENDSSASSSAMNQDLADRTVLVGAEEIRDFILSVEEELNDDFDEMARNSPVRPFNEAMTPLPIDLELGITNEMEIPTLHQWDPSAPKPSKDDDIDF